MIRFPMFEIYWMYVDKMPEDSNCSFLLVTTWQY